MGNSTLKIDSLRSLSQIFTNSSFRNIICKKDVSYFEYSLKSHLKGYSFQSYREVIKFLYDKLSQDYCNEYIFKNTLLHQNLLSKYSSTKNAIMLDEFKIGNSIADFILFNGSIKIFEIKTDLDSFAKLDKQIVDYRKFADTVDIVVSYNNKNIILERYKNTDIGIIYLNRSGNLTTLKKSKENKSFLDHETIFKVLRKNEYLSIIREEYGNDDFEMLLKSPNTLIFKKAFDIVKKIDILKLQKLVLAEVKKRKTYVEYKEFLNDTPLELQHICYNLNFNKEDYLKLNNFLNTTA